MSDLALQLIEEEKEAKTGKLDLGRCGLTDVPDAVFDLLWLEELSLSNAYWDDELREWIESPNDGELNYLEVIPPAIGQLKELKILSCGGAWSRRWKIKDISVLQPLINLQALDLNNNQIQDISVLKQWTGLRSLSLSRNRVAKLTALRHLDQLEALYLESNPIRSLDVLGHLRGLTVLQLDCNRNEDYSFLNNLLKLQVLSLSNIVAKNTSFLRGLDNLKSLSLNWPKRAKKRKRHFSTLRRFTGLRLLQLSNTRIKYFSFLQDLTNLQSLAISNCKISDVSALQDLTGLQHLSLTNNQIRNPSALKHLINLQELNLADNQVEDLSGLLPLIELGNMQISLRQGDFEDKINLSNNPIKNPPLAIVEQGNQAVIEYLEAPNPNNSEPNELEITAGEVIEQVNVNDREPNKILTRSDDFSRSGPGTTKVVTTGLEVAEQVNVSDNERDEVKIRTSYAAKLVEKERVEKTGRLNLGGCGLMDDLPESLFELAWLEELNLRNRYWDHEKEERFISQNTGGANWFEIFPLGIITKLRKLKSFRLHMYLGFDDNILRLSELRGLEVLDLSHFGDIKDISFLSSLSNLRWLDLANNKIKTLSALKGLRKLRILDLSQNSIHSQSDFSCFEGFDNLEILNLSHNRIQDISFLRKRTTEGPLRSLYLAHNGIKDISVLQEMTNLQTLDLKSNYIKDISALQHLTNLQTLNLKGCGIRDISPLLPLIKAGQMEVSLEWYDNQGKINLHGNRIQHPPEEIVKQGNQAIIEYFEGR